MTGKSRPNASPKILEDQWTSAHVWISFAEKLYWLPSLSTVRSQPSVSMINASHDQSMIAVCVYDPDTRATVVHNGRWTGSNPIIVANANLDLGGSPC